MGLIVKNKGKWKPSKYVNTRGELVATENLKELGVGSRLIANITAEYYDHHIKKYAKGKLLDLGCGKVPLFAAYRRRVTSNVCVDWEHSSHEHRYADYEYDIEEGLRFEDEEFDTIILSDVLEHIRRPLKLWNEMSRVLSKGGTILLNVPFYYWIHEEPYDYHRYTEFALRDFAQSCGLKIIVLDAIGGIPEILTDILAKNILWFPILGRSIAVFVQKAALSFRRTAFGKRLSLKTSRNFPFGYFVVAQKDL